MTNEPYTCWWKRGPLNSICLSHCNIPFYLEAVLPKQHQPPSVVLAFIQSDIFAKCWRESGDIQHPPALWGINVYWQTSTLTHFFFFLPVWFYVCRMFGLQGDFVMCLTPTYLVKCTSTFIVKENKLSTRFPGSINRERRCVSLVHPTRGSLGFQRGSADTVDESTKWLIVE